MISIERGACPDKLDTTRKKIAANDYQHDTVVSALLVMQHNKCCYCETDILKVGATARWVDHFIAKTDVSFKDCDGKTNWKLANAWSNLLMSCSTCNRSKGTEEPFDSKTGKRRLIDPSDPKIDPENHIEFMIEDVFIVYKSRNGSTLGKNTIENLKLKARNDIYSLLRKRKAEIDSIFNDLVNALTENNLIMAKSKQNDLRKMTSAHQPHASFCRKYIIQVAQKFNNDNLKKINKYYGLKIEPLEINIASGFQKIV
ncbi:MAG: hypothetical protein A2X08_07575 [Bacteroidetes bacterium GWA2_32_17]|nr:MAG: hypothetical protein A2X08_07575 [Bacteroidetes bacterium GWA2_32_17]